MPLEGQFFAQECSQGYREPRKADRENRGRDLPVWMNTTLKNLSYDGSTEWETFIHRFRLVSDQMGLRDPERAEFLVSTLQRNAFTAIMYARRARGDLSFKEICNRLASRYEGDFSTPAAAWMNLGQAFQQRNESLFQWSDRLNRIGDSIFRLDLCGRNSIETRLVSKFCFAAWDRETGVKTTKLELWKRHSKALGSISMSRVRLILVAPSGLQRMYGDGRRKGIAGTDTTRGAIRTAGMSAIGKILERYNVSVTVAGIRKVRGVPPCRRLS